MADDRIQCLICGRKLLSIGPHLAALTAPGSGVGPGRAAGPITHGGGMSIGQRSGGCADAGQRRYEPCLQQEDRDLDQDDEPIGHWSKVPHCVN